MIKGKIEMIFEEDGAHVEVNVELDSGLAAKCFIIESLCQALQLNGNEKINALMCVALKDRIQEDSE